MPTASSLYNNATVQDLLDMRTGVKADDNIHEYRAAAGWNPLRGDEDASAKSLHAYIEGLQADVDESKGFNYSSVNTDLLGWVLEAATGKKLAELISELLWKPMGAESDALITVDREGSARAAGGACVTLRDIARIGQLIADGGRDVVPKAWIDDMLHGGDNDAWEKGTFAPGFRGVLGEGALPRLLDCGPGEGCADGVGDFRAAVDGGCEGGDCDGEDVVDGGAGGLWEGEGADCGVWGD